jgi:autotransporter-associated beta strand protein
VGAGASADLGGFDQTVGSIGGSGSILLGRGTMTTGGDGTSGLFAGVISGSGSVVKTGGGALVLTGANTYSGGTQVLGGALVGDTRSLQGNILNNALVQFDQNADGTYGASMSGTGALAKTGAGTLTLTGTNTYSGGTLITGGAVVGTASSLRGLIVNNAQLTLGGAGDGIFAGTLSGGGRFTKTGTGTLTVNGTQTLSGLFTVAQGTLALNGVFGGSLDVASGAILRASGVIAGSVNVAGSLFAVPPPGTPSLQAALLDARQDLEVPSFLTIGRDLTATSGSLLDFAIGPGATPTILVGGTASLTGARLNITAPSIGDARSASFLALAAANGLSMVNSTVTTGDATVIPVLKQNRNSLFVTLLNLNVPLRTVSGPTTISVADAIDRTKFGASGDAGFVIRELTALDDRGLVDALEQIGGQLHATVLQTAVLDTEMLNDMVRDELQAREMEDVADVRWWGETACQHANFKATDRARGGNADVCTGAGGVDRRFSDRWTIGGGGSYTGGNMGLGSMGSGDYTAPRAFGYLGYKPARFGFRGGGSAAHSSYKTRRQIVFQALLPVELGAEPLSEGIDRKAESEQQGTTTDSWSEIHDSRKRGTYTIEGLLGIRHARISRGSFSETGALALSLNAAEQIIKLTQTDVRLHLWRRSGTYRPFLDANYRRELAAGGTTAALAFSGLANSNFQVQGIGVPLNMYSGRLGMTLATFAGQATFTYEFKQAPGQRRQTASIRFRFK